MSAACLARTCRIRCRRVVRSTTLDELRAVVAHGESTSLEFKATTGQRSDGARSLVGMLNGFGGRVLFGVTPDGTIVGQDVSDRTLEQLAGELQRIEPTVVPEVQVVDLGNGRSVIVVRVERGQLRPYEHRGRAFKRLANTTVEMAQHEVDQVLLERMHGTDRWENRVALGWTVDDLDGNEVRKTVREAVQRGRLVDPGSTDPVEIVRRLGLDTRDGALVRAAVVLFGRSDSLLPEYPQCRLRLARFRGVDRTEFVDGREFHGHAFDLLNRAQQFLLDHMPVSGRVAPGVFQRVDAPLLPPEALREALANAFCHRDYSIGGGSVAVAMYDDRVEVTSSGGLHFSLTIEDLFRPHESLPWNPLIARVFYLRGIVERWGRGIERMVELMDAAGLARPEIEAAAGAVTVRFRPTAYVAPTGVRQDLSDLQRAILEVLAEGGSLAPSAIRAILIARGGNADDEVPLRRVRDALVELRTFGLVAHDGHGRGSRWFLSPRA